MSLGVASKSKRHIYIAADRRATTSVLSLSKIDGGRFKILVGGALVSHSDLLEIEPADGFNRRAIWVNAKSSQL